MSFNVTFWQHAKKENSTKLPTSGSGDVFTTYSCLLKDTSSVEHPSLWLTNAAASPAWNPANWNYAYIPDFGRYYFVDNWEWEKPYWTVSLSVDVLASFRTDILSSSKYVLRSASDYNDKIMDDAYSPTANSTISQNVAAIPYASNTGQGVLPRDGSIVLGITGGYNPSSYSEITYYVLTDNELRAFQDYMFTNILSMNWQDNDAWNAVISKALTDPLDYIVSAYFVPLRLNDTNFPSAVSPRGYPIHFGFWEYTPSSGSGLFPIMRDRVFKQTISITNPPNPYYDSMTWELLPPFTKYAVNLGAGGIHQLNGQAVYGGGGITVDMIVDVGTGICCYKVHPYNQNPVILETTAQYCPPIPIGRQRSDILGMINAGSSLITGPAAGAALGASGGPLGAVAGGLIGAGKAVIGAGLNILDSSSFAMSGSMGSMASLSDSISLDLQCHQAQPRNDTEIGKPLCAVRQLSTLSGFTLCADGEISSGSMYSEERSKIEHYLTTGFYIE